MNLERSLSFFKALIESPTMMRIKILQSFPSFVIDDLLEIIINIVRGNVILSEERTKALKKHKKTLLTLVNTKNKRLMKKVLYEQDGSFIATLLPIALDLLSLDRF